MYFKKLNIFSELHNMSAETSAKRKRRHDDEDHYVSPIQTDPTDIEFETLLDKKKRNVRLLSICEVNLESLNKNVDKMYRCQTRQQAFMFLAKLSVALRAFLLKRHLHCPLLLDANVVSVTEVEDLKDLVYLCLTIMKRIKMTIHETIMHCPKKQDELFDLIHEFRDPLTEFTIRLEK